MIPLPDGYHAHDHLDGDPSHPGGRARVPAPRRYLLALADAPYQGDPYVLDFDFDFDYGYGNGFLGPDGLEGRLHREAR
ncbi:hypothetical protein ACIQI7_01945 [Kitasatospora sp. NPDC092039]|uniref:hypothetical protein n=1 Tax=Kitasatospora sp. NPDC092039 TaxID=3364086 RepID=UPI003804AE25